MSDIQFDPKTGEVINQEAVNNQADQTGNKSNQENEKQSEKKKVPIILLAAGGAALIIAVLILIAFKAGLFMSDSDKVLLACANTYKNSELMQALDTREILQGDTFTANVAGTMEAGGGTAKLDAVFVQNTAGKRQTLESRIQAGGLDLNISEYMNDEKLLVKIPLLGNDYLMYDFTAKKEGVLAKQFSEAELAAFDKIFQSYFDLCEQSKKYNAEISAVLLKDFRELTFEKAESEICEVDGTDRKCKGYKTKISGTDLADMMEDCKEVDDEYYGEYRKALMDAGSAYTEQLNKKTSMEKAREELETIPELEVTFYINKAALAQVKLKADTLDGSLEFKSADSMKLALENNQGKISMETVYDKKTGDFTYTLNDGDRTSTFDANIQRKNDKLTVAFENINLNDSIVVSGNISVEMGGKTEEPDGSGEIDIFNASAGELMKLIPFGSLY